MRGLVPPSRRFHAALSALVAASVSAAGACTEPAEPEVALPEPPAPRCISRGWECASNAICTPEGDGILCACPPGWDGDGWTCLPPLDPCRANGGCDPNAECTPQSGGGRTCACKLTYEGDGLTCLEVDLEVARWPVADVPTFEVRGLVAVDRTTGLAWQRPTYGWVTGWEEAKKHCDELSFEGASDWRLPTRIELLSLVDPTRRCPTIDTDVFTEMRPEPVSQMIGFASSTPFLGEEGCWWGVRFDEGTTAVGCSASYSTMLVRCVRAAE